MAFKYIFILKYFMEKFIFFLLFIFEHFFSVQNNCIQDKIKHNIRVLENSEININSSIILEKLRIIQKKERKFKNIRIKFDFKCFVFFLNTLKNILK